MTYRPDVDGLRAVAVLAVMLYHFGLTGLSGGYVGVDIFFVISGYLIGGIIIAETTSGNFSYQRFYLRRIKRLFAAFFLVSLVTIPIACWLLLPTDLRAYGKSLVAAATFLPNVFFYRETGYFSTAAITKPLLHTWSLGVEEQFYLFFPMLMAFAVRVGSKFTAGALVITTLVSIAGAQWLLSVDPAGSFYWLPARAWELTLGAVLALPCLRELRIEVCVRRVLGALAVAALIAPLFLYSERTAFPGLAALPPCLGTAWFLWSGGSAANGSAPRWLTARLPVAVGRISYSLYLWHWPVFMFLAYYLASDIPVPLRLAALLLVFVLAMLSWRFVERPIRVGSARAPAVFCGAFLGSALLVGVGIVLWRSNGIPARLSAETRVIASAADDFLQDWGVCVPGNNKVWPGVPYCSIGAPGARETFLIWGDSHVRALHDGASRLAKEHGLAGRVVWAGGCMPAFDIVKRESASSPRQDQECAAQNSAVKLALQKPGPIKNVLLVGRWAYYTEGRGIGSDAQNQISMLRPGSSAAATDASSDQAKTVADALRNTVRWLSDRGYAVYLLEQVPEIPEFSGRKLFQGVRSGREDVNGALAQFGTVPRAQVDARQQTANEALRQAAMAGHARILPTHQLFCSGETCSAWRSWGPAYFDNNHLTVASSIQIRAVLLPAMAP